MLEFAEPRGAQRILAALGIGGAAVGVGNDRNARRAEPVHHLDAAGHRGRLARAALFPLVPDLEVKTGRSEEHTSELQSLMRISYAVFCLKKKKKHKDLHQE